MSADDNAPEQAREVEVVARALCLDACGCHPADDDSAHCVDHRLMRHRAEVALVALAPIRAAERQQAAREALIEAAEAIIPDAYRDDPEMCPTLYDPWDVADQLNARANELDRKDHS